MELWRHTRYARLARRLSGFKQIEKLDEFSSVLGAKENLRALEVVLSYAFGKFLFDQLRLETLRVQLITNQNWGVIFRAQCACDVVVTNDGTFLESSVISSGINANKSTFLIKGVEAQIQITDEVVKVNSFNADYTLSVENTENLANFEPIRQKVKQIIDKQLKDAIVGQNLVAKLKKQPQKQAEPVAAAQ